MIRHIRRSNINILRNILSYISPNKRYKKSQVTVFIIIGMILFISAMLVIFLRSSYVVGSLKPEIYKGNNLEQQFISLNKYIEFCIQTVANPQDQQLSPIMNIAKQGGRLTNLTNAIEYMGDSVNALCEGRENIGCVNN